MKYERIEDVDLTNFFSAFTPNAGTIYQGLNLPMLKFKRDHVEYEVTDLRPLNQDAIHVFEVIIQLIKENPEMYEWQFEIPEDFTEDDVSLIVDIIMALSVKATKRGKNGYSAGGKLLCCSAYMNECDGKRYITFNSHDPDGVKAIYECVKENKTVSLFDIAIAVINRAFKRDIDYVKELCEKEQK